jgi:exodeoxyribonuclease VIII
MDNTTYHTDTSRVSKSGLDKVAKLPALYELHYLRGQRDKPTKDMLLGSAVHDYILEPAEFWKQHPGAYTDDHLTACKLMKAAIAAHPIASSLLLCDGSAEVFRAFEYRGAPCKVKADFLPDHTPLIVDIKTTTDASPEGFRRSVRKFRYHVQREFYLEGFPERQDMVFIAIETAAPYRVEVYSLGVDLIQEGRELLDSAVDTYVECRKTGIWPNYTQKIITEL